MSDLYYNYTEDMLRDVSAKDVLDMEISNVERYTDLKPEEVPPEAEIYGE